eukprot:jgi/Mesvir1/1318/Mv04915-RA.1
MATPNSSPVSGAVVQADTVPQAPGAPRKPREGDDSYLTHKQAAAARRDPIRPRKLFKKPHAHCRRCGRRTTRVALMRMKRHFHGGEECDILCKRCREHDGFFEWRMDYARVCDYQIAEEAGEQVLRDFGHPSAACDKKCKLIRERSEGDVIDLMFDEHFDPFDEDDDWNPGWNRDSDGTLDESEDDDDLSDF